MKVGFVGLGAMGVAMARNLIAAGHTVRAWNRSGIPDLNGIESVSDVVDAFHGDAVFTMLSDDDAIRTVLLDANVLARARSGLVHVVSSTISVAFSEELARVHADAGVRYLAAPVLGRPDVAARGELNILVGGDSDAIDAIRPLFEVLGKNLWQMGREPSHANAAKIAVNMMITMAIEAMTEAVAITETHGLSREAFFDLILGTLFDSRPYRTYSANIAADQYEPGFKAILGLKDLRLALEAAGNRDLPMLRAVREQMQAAIDAGLGERDWSVMATVTLSGREDR